MDTRRLAAAYLVRAHARHDSEPESELRRLLADDPDEALVFVEAAIDAARTTDNLGFIGASALEDLMKMWGGRFADRLIAKVREDARWAYAARIIRGAAGAEEAIAVIPGVWPDLEAAARARLGTG